MQLDCIAHLKILPCFKISLLTRWLTAYAYTLFGRAQHGAALRGLTRSLQFSPLHALNSADQPQKAILFQFLVHKRIPLPTFPFFGTWTSLGSAAMPLNTYIAPLSKVLGTMVPSIAATGGLYYLFRHSWPSAPSWSTEWEEATIKSYSAFVSHRAFQHISIQFRKPGHET